MEFHNAVGMFLDDGGAWIVVLVDPVAKAHQLDVGFFVLDLTDELLSGHAGVANKLQHFEDGLVCATVLRAGQGVDACGNRRVHVGTRRRDHTDRRG